MTSLERARDLPHPPAVVAGVGFGSKPLPQSGYFSQAGDLLTTAATMSGPKAYREAGLTAADVDVAEIYDCFSISMLLQLEDLGFAEKGAGAQLRRVRRHRSGRRAAGQHARRSALPSRTSSVATTSSRPSASSAVIAARRRSTVPRSRSSPASVRPSTPRCC